MSDFLLASSSVRRSWMLGSIVALFFPLLGLKRAFSIIGIGLAIYGAVLLAQRWRVLSSNPAVRAGFLIAACFGLPLIFALTDAAFPAISFVATLSSLLYLPILVAVIVLVQEQNITKPMLLCSILITTFWVFDGLIQLSFGQDIFGMAYNGYRIGAYWQNQMKFGYYMGFYGLFAVAAFAVYMPSRPLLLTIFWLHVALGVLIGGNREAWLMFFPFSAFLFWVHVASKSRYRYWLLLGGIILAIMLSAAAYEFSFTVRDRIDQSLSALQWSYESIDKASSKRLELWRVAIELIAAHPFNGQGLDSYQSLFPNLAQQKYWMGLTEGPYPHQYLLEVATATGGIGLLGVMAIYLIIKRHWQSASSAQRAMAWPALIYLMALWFPLNTHRSFYSSELIMGNLLMIGLILGNLLPLQKSTELADLP